MDLQERLPVLYSLACEWAEEQSKFILNRGVRLKEHDLSLACAVGVKEIERIRILVVPFVPIPAHPLLKAACAQLNFLENRTEALTISYGIYIKAGLQDDRRLLTHELRHVAQFEQHSSIASYLSVYLSELIQFGYSAMPLELDAESAADLHG
jgi:hypothetical protein